MVLKDVTFLSPKENIVFDEVLFSLAEKNNSGEVLRFWESQTYCGVLGKGASPQDDFLMDTVKKDRLPVFRRCSGGGTVLQGRGSFNFSVVCSKEMRPQLRTIQQSYAYILGKIIEGLAALGVQAVFKPICDIALAQSLKKISGNAQRRGRKYILHHGTLLYDFDISQAQRYLAMPLKKPAYRRERTHKNFLANAPVDKEEFAEKVTEIFCVRKQSTSLSEEEKETHELFLATKEVEVPLSTL